MKRTAIGVILVNPDTPGLGLNPSPEEFEQFHLNIWPLIAQKSDEILPPDVKGYDHLILSQTQIEARGQVVRTAIVFEVREV